MKSRIQAVTRIVNLLLEEGVCNSNTLREIATRVSNLGQLYSNLMRLNDRYIEIDPLRSETVFDEQSGIMSIKLNGDLIHSLTLKRADPSIPVKLVNSSSFSSFVAMQDEEGEVQSVRDEIAKEIEIFYYNANKLLDLVEKGLLKKNRKQFIGVSMVRNKLIEHTEDGDIYSFGVSKEFGPTVKPQKLVSRREKPNDMGLVKNTIELLSLIESRMRKLLP